MVKRPKRSTITLETPTQPHVENMEETATDTAEEETTPVPEEVFSQVIVLVNVPIRYLHSTGQCAGDIE
jgi:hypothetical protein